MATLSWNEMRDRAVPFVARWRDEKRERAEKDTFWNEFFAIFGIDRRRVAVFEHLSTRHSTTGRGWMDVFWPGYIAAEHKSRGEDLDAALKQALDYLPSLPAEYLPTLVVVCDFGTFVVRNQLTGETVTFPIDDLPKALNVFGPMLDYDSHKYETEEDVNLAATALLAALHDALRDTGYDGHELRVLLTRLLFILFADDTQVWDQSLFYDYLLLKTGVDGRDLGPALIHLFQVLDTPKGRRSALLDEDLARFEYINGSLFSEPIRIPDCNRAMRESLLVASRFDWSKISPAIFGSLFQNVMDAPERRALGAHYTTEQNILKTIGPLFLDDLTAELDAAATLPALKRFQDRLSALTFLDPACGCGNFLILAYREIRRLELECLRRIRARERQGQGSVQLVVDVSIESKVHVGQFYGIEVEEFPARIAETAMYLIDHLENLRLSAEFGQYYARFPIADSAHITISNAVRTDWSEVLPPARCSYILGNPPFIGKYLRTAEQTKDLALALPASQNSGLLDYVTAWYAKAARYIQGTAVRVAFVSTNSITQGEQAPLLWTSLAEQDIHIDFAHRTFAWTSEAKGRAAVHVVIIGFSAFGQASRKRLFTYETLKSAPVETVVAQINPYLAPAPFTLVERRRTPLLAGLPAASFGSKPTDGGHLLLDVDEVDWALADPIAARYVRQYIGAKEMLSGQQRWCLWLADATPADIRDSPVLRMRLSAVRASRRASKKVATQALGDKPALFEVDNQPRSGTYLALPQTSSENRICLPGALYDHTVIANNGVIIVPGADEWVFGLFHSAMWMSWVRTVSGRLKSDPQISPRVVCNTFPFPNRATPSERRIVAAAQEVLDARAAHDGAPLDLLYDPVAMPDNLVTAHRNLDRAVDSAYNPRKKFAAEVDRQAELFERYVALTKSEALPR